MNTPPPMAAGPAHLISVESFTPFLLYKGCFRTHSTGLALRDRYEIRYEGISNENLRKNHPFCRGGRSHKDTWAGCTVSRTTDVNSLFNASRSVSSRSFAEKVSSVFLASYFLR
jgi:hypothetical protein